MSVRTRFFAFLLLPLLAAGVGGLRWAHVAIAHGEAGEATETACSHRHHGPCGQSHGPVAAFDVDEGDESDAPVSDHDGCLDCDLLAVMVSSATHDGSAPIAAMTGLDRVVDPLDVAAIAASETHRARPPPVA